MKIQGLVSMSIEGMQVILMVKYLKLTDLRDMAIIKVLKVRMRVLDPGHILRIRTS